MKARRPKRWAFAIYKSINDLQNINFACGLFLQQNPNATNDTVCSEKRIYGNDAAKQRCVDELVDLAKSSQL